MSNRLGKQPLVIECEQNSPEWFEHRCGRPTASNFKKILAKGEGKVRDEYLRKIAGERLSGEPAESFSNSYTDRGHTMEPEALSAYELLTDETVRKVGLVVHRDGMCSCSPDGLVGDKGIVEFKSQSPHIMVETIRLDRMPPEHMAQVQGCLWICEREWCDVVCYYRTMPVTPRFRIFRDDKFIKDLYAAVLQFNKDCDALCALVRNYGVR
jgi:hypothetical protein